MGLFSITAIAQDGNIGVNIDKPNATLHMEVAPVNADNETNQGLIVPRMSKSRVAKIISPVESTIVYITDDSTSPISAYKGNDPKVSNVFTKGHYIFQDNTWSKMNTTKPQESIKKSFTCTASNLGQTLRSSDGYFKCVDMAPIQTGLYGWEYHGVVYVDGLHFQRTSEPNKLFPFRAKTTSEFIEENIIQYPYKQPYVYNLYYSNRDDMSTIINFSDVMMLGGNTYGHNICLDTNDTANDYTIISDFAISTASLEYCSNNLNIEYKFIAPVRIWE